MAEPEKKEPSLEERVETLTADLAKEREANKSNTDKLQVYERTLQALNTQQPQRQQQQAAPNVLTGLTPEARQRLRQRLGEEWTDQVLDQHDRIFDVFIQEKLGPIVQQFAGALGTIYDRVDYHDVSLDDGDFKKYKPEVEQERQARMQRGEAVVSRKELTQIVKARHFADEVAAETQKKIAEENERRAAGKSAGTASAGAGVQKVGAEIARKPKTLDSKDIDSLPTREERIKAIEDAAGDTPIP